MEQDYFDTELLIVELSNRPALWNQQMKEYSDKNHKEKLWKEVFMKIFSNFEEMDAEERFKKVFQIQNKWKNLKDNFRKELRLQHKTKSGCKRKRKYIYFDQLLFLLPTVEEKQTSGNHKSLVNAEKISIRKEKYCNNEDKIEKENNTYTSRNSIYNEEIISLYNKVEEKHNYNIKNKKQENKIEPKKPMLSFEKSLLKILQESKKEELDEDKSFLLSLLPSLKTLPIQQKFNVKMEFLESLRRAVTSSLSQYPLPQYYNSIIYQNSKQTPCQSSQINLDTCSTSSQGSVVKIEHCSGSPSSQTSACTTPILSPENTGSNSDLFNLT